jgi:hypothetical protein
VVFSFRRRPLPRSGEQEPEQGNAITENIADTAVLAARPTLSRESRIELRELNARIEALKQSVQRDREALTIAIQRKRELVGSAE